MTLCQAEAVTKRNRYGRDMNEDEMEQNLVLLQVNNMADHNTPIAAPAYVQNLLKLSTCLFTRLEESSLVPEGFLTAPYQHKT